MNCDPRFTFLQDTVQVEKEAADHSLIGKNEATPYEIEADTYEPTQEEFSTDNFALEEFQLTAPAVLFKKREYPPLHIFVSLNITCSRLA